MSELTREQVVVGLDELRAALLDTAVLAKGGMSELVLQEAIAALSSPCGGKVLAVVKGQIFCAEDVEGRDVTDLALEEWLDLEPQSVRVIILPEPQGEGRDGGG